MSALAVVVALGSYGFSEWRRRRDARLRDVQTARAIGIKLLSVHNGLHDIKRHVCVDKRPLSPSQPELWRRTHPLIGLRLEPGLTLDAAETNLLLEMKQADHLMNQMLLTARYQSILSSMMEYKTRYEAMQSMLPAPVSKDGSTFTHILDEQQRLRLEPYSIQLETLLISVRSMLEENAELSARMLKEYPGAAEKHFGKPIIKLEAVA